MITMLDKFDIVVLWWRNGRKQLNIHIFITVNNNDEFGDLMVAISAGGNNENECMEQFKQLCTQQIIIDDRPCLQLWLKQIWYPLSLLL